jgi:hypothetical protein
MDYPKDPKYAAYFFRRHSFEELQAWTERMRFFRFCRAIGGHANDGDMLLAALRVESEADLVAVAAALGIALRELPADTPAPVPGRIYRGDELARFPSRIDGHPRFEQPGTITLAGVRCFAWVFPGRLELQLSGAAGDGYEVTEEDVRNAVTIEAAMAPVADRVIDPPLKGERCFTR